MNAADFLPYVLLLISLLLGWRVNRKAALTAAGLAVVAGLVVGKLTPMALLSLGALMLSVLAPWPWIGCLVFLVISVALFSHLAPGFKNLLIYDHVQFSSDSLPFTMYLNFDKTFAGLLAYLYFIRPNQPPQFLQKNWRVVLTSWFLLTVVLLPTTLLFHYVRLDLKWPPQGWLWALNNLFFVCLAEEAIFRGVIQGQLAPKVGAPLAVIVAAVLFGASHFQGGVPYVAFATISGLFYGYAYLKTKRIESSIVVHFALNLVHFAFFSYPALQI